MATGFFRDERCFRHGGGNYAGMLPVRGLVQPAATGGLPENPATKRCLKNLIEVTGPARDRAMTRMVQDAAAALCGGRLVVVHEGGCSETHVPFCGHAVLEELSGSAVRAPDPAAATHARRQPGPEFDAFLDARPSAMAAALA